MAENEADGPASAEDVGPTSAEEEGFRFSPGSAEVPRPVRWVVLAALGLVAVTRSPYIFRYGRFWAEEGRLHFGYMLAHSFPKNILYVQTRTGYYNAFADWSTWLAAQVPLRHAPLVTVWISLGAVLVLVWIALAWQSDLLPNAASRLAAAAVVVVGTMAIAEAWVNTINAQTYLGVLTLLLVFVRVDDLSRSRYCIGIGLLVVAGLSGLYSVALVPLFLVCGLLDHSRRRWGYAATITAMGVIQALVLAHSRASGKLAGSKVALPGAASVFRGFVGWHVAGLLVSRATVATWESRALIHGRGAVYLVLFAGTVLVLLGVLLFSGTAHRVALLLLAALVLVEVLVQVGDLKGDAGGRYAVVPVAILSLMFIHGAATSRSQALRWGGSAVVGLIVVGGLYQFWSADPNQLACRQGCPTWAYQVQRYQRGETTSIQVWPYDPPHWFVNLPPRPASGQGALQPTSRDGKERGDRRLE